MPSRGSSRCMQPGIFARSVYGRMWRISSTTKAPAPPYVGPGDYNGEKAVFVDGKLGEVEPMAYRFMLNFAQDNDLQIVDGVCSIDGKK